MRSIKLSGKEFKLKATVGSIRKILKKYNVSEMTTWPQEKTLRFSLELLWEFIQPVRFFKPYFFFRIFERNMDVEDIRKIMSVLFSLFYGVEIGEDKESGNVQTMKEMPLSS